MAPVAHYNLHVLMFNAWRIRPNDDAYWRWRSRYLRECPMFDHIYAYYAYKRMLAYHRAHWRLHWAKQHRVSRTLPMSFLR